MPAAMNSNVMPALGDELMAVIKKTHAAEKTLVWTVTDPHAVELHQQESRTE